LAGSEEGSEDMELLEDDTLEDSDETALEDSDETELDEASEHADDASVASAGSCRSATEKRAAAVKAWLFHDGFPCASDPPPLAIFTRAASVSPWPRLMNLRVHRKFHEKPMTWLSAIFQCWRSCGTGEAALERAPPATLAQLWTVSGRVR
jgi:hypothetical protein